MEKLLYHFTSLHHLPEILSAGYLKLTESNLSPKVKTYKPVVWLTTSETGINFGVDKIDELNIDPLCDKRTIKITIPYKRYFKKWKIWSRQNNINPELAHALGDGYNPKEWYISERIIFVKDFLKVENTVTGEIYLDKKK